MLRVLEANRLMSRGREGLSFGWLLGGRECDWDIQRFWAVKDAPSARKRKGRMQGGITLVLSITKGVEGKVRIA